MTKVDIPLGEMWARGDGTRLATLKLWNELTQGGKPPPQHRLEMVLGNMSADSILKTYNYGCRILLVRELEGKDAPRYVLDTLQEIRCELELRLGEYVRV